MSEQDRGGIVRLGQRAAEDANFVVQADQGRFELGPLAAELWQAASGVTADVLVQAARKVEPGADRNRVFAVLDELRGTGLVGGALPAPAEPTLDRRSLFKALAFGAAAAAVVPAVARAASPTGQGELCSDVLSWKAQEQEFKDSAVLAQHALKQVQLAKEEQKLKAEKQLTSEQEAKSSSQNQENQYKQAKLKQEADAKKQSAALKQEQQDKLSQRHAEQKTKAQNQEQHNKLELQHEQAAKKQQLQFAQEEENKQKTVSAMEQKHKREAAELAAQSKKLGAMEQEQKKMISAQEEAQKSKVIDQVESGGYGPQLQAERTQKSSFTSIGYGIFGAGRSTVYLDAMGQSFTGSVWLEQISQSNVGGFASAPLCGLNLPFELESSSVQGDQGGGEASDNPVVALAAALQAANAGTWDLPEQPKIALQWGKQAEFGGVFYLNSAKTHYTGFDANGTPTKITATLTLIPA